MIRIIILALVAFIIWSALRSKHVSAFRAGCSAIESRQDAKAREVRDRADKDCFEFDHSTHRDGKDVKCRMVFCGQGAATLWCDND